MRTTQKDVNYEGTDVAASAMVAVIVLGGVVAAWQTADQLVATIYFFGSLLTACLVGGIYLYGRLKVLDNEQRSLLGDEPPETIGRPGREESDGGVIHAEPVAETGDNETDDDPGAEPALPAARRAELLADYPEDERRIIDPILATPGLTQVDVRDRSNFSKSKVSQTVTDLEDRGLIRRERDGRTYRIYPDGELDVAR